MLHISEHSVEAEAAAYPMESLKRVRSSRVDRKIARVLSILAACCLLLLLLPWRQTVTSKGKLTALNPQDRPQEVPAIIPGRILSWHVREGQPVRRGDTLLVLGEIKQDYFDPNTQALTERQVQAKKEALEASRQKVEAQRQQVAALRQGLTLSLSKAQNKLRQARLKLQSDSMDYQAAKVDNDIAKTQYERQELLYKQGLKSLAELENRRLKYQESTAKLLSSRNKYFASQQELGNARIELSSLAAEYGDKIAKAESERTGAQSYAAGTEAEIAKMENYAANLRIRSGYSVVRAPQDGYVVRVGKEGIGEQVKEGESICTIMPLNPSLAVELFADPSDVAFLKEGDEVRLRFDGFPVLQVSGWPNIAIGTFKGKVQVIDRVADAKGSFRYLVTPVEEWPKSLRLGGGVMGWTLMRQVPIWFELWRRLNSFPPSLEEEGEKKQTQDKKG